MQTLIAPCVRGVRTEKETFVLYSINAGYKKKYVGVTFVNPESVNKQIVIYNYCVL